MPTSATPDPLREIREDILQGNLVAASSLALLSAPYWAWVTLDLGAPEQLLFALSGVSVVVIVTLLRRWLPFSVRASALLGIWTLAAWFVLWTGGLPAIGAVMIACAAVMAVLLHGWRGTVIWAIVALLAITTVVVRYLSGHVPAVVIPYGSIEWWIAFSVGTLPFVIPVAISTAVLVRRVQEAASSALQEAEARQRALEELRSTQQRLEHAARMEVLGQVAGGLAHDLNNGLTVILMGAEAIKDQARLEPADVEGLNDVVAAAERSAALTRQMLTLARRDVARPRPVDLHRRLRQLARVLERTLPATVQLQLDLAAERAVVEVDPDQLHQAILNLAINARDAMPSGGTLRLHTHGTEDTLWIDIIDTGQGMDPATAARALEPFFTTKEAGAGTGLGLPNVVSFAERNGGSLQVDSRMGSGTRIRIALPRSARPVEDLRPSSVEVEGEPSRILVVEDDIRVRAMLCSTLAHAGYRVTEARDGEEALYQLHQADFDLVLTDLVMPGLSGTGLLRRLRERSDPPSVVICSGYAPEPALRAELEAGAIPFLGKPFRRNELLRLVRDTVGPASSRRTGAR